MTRKTAWAMGPALTLGGLKQSTPRPAKHVCRNHTWINSKFNRRCSKCGVEVDKPQLPEYGVDDLVRIIMNTKRPKAACAMQLTPLQLSHCYTLHSFLRGWPGPPWFTTFQLAREFGMTVAMISNSLDRLMMAGAPIEFTLDGKPYYTHQNFNADDIERWLNNRFCNERRFRPKYRNGRYFADRLIDDDMRRIDNLLNAFEMRYGKVAVDDALNKCGLK